MLKYVSNKMILDGEINNAKTSSFSSDFQTLIKEFLCGLLMSLRNKEKQREKPQKASLCVWKRSLELWKRLRCFSQWTQKKGNKDFFILLREVISYAEKRLGLQYLWGHWGAGGEGTGAFGELYVPLKKSWLRPFTWSKRRGVGAGAKNLACEYTRLSLLIATREVPVSVPVPVFHHLKVFFYLIPKWE